MRTIQQNLLQTLQVDQKDERERGRDNEGKKTIANTEICLLYVPELCAYFMCSILEWNSLRCGNFETPPHLLALTRLMDLCFLNLQIEPYMNFKCASNKPSNPPAVLPFSVGVIELNPKVIRPNDFPAFSASQKVCSEICITIYRLRGTPFLLYSFYLCAFCRAFSLRLSETEWERKSRASAPLTLLKNPIRV